MKRLSFFIMICLLTSFGAGAVDTIVDGIKYSLDVEHKTAEVIQNTYTGDIVIPAAIDYEGENYNVTSIGYAAFYLSTIRSIVIPYGVTEIGGGAFAGCDYLERVSLPEGIKTIKENTFDHCKSLTSIYLPQSLTTIEQKAFAWSGLESITIPNGVTVIEPYTFIWCSSFSCIDLPETLKSIDGRAFWWCHLLSVTCRALEVPEVIESGEFIYPNSTLIVPATSIEAYKSAEGWGSFGTVEPITPHHPFVEAGKLWRVHGFNMGSSHRVTDYYFSDDDEAETIDGHTYLKMYAKTGEETTLVGLFREENRRVYLYKKDAGREFLTYDFSLQEGEWFSPEYGDYSLCEVKEVSYKKVNGEQLKVITFEANDRQFDADVRTQVEWIEGIGSSSWPLAGLYSGNLSSSWSYNTAYVLYDNTYNNNYYLPLTFGVPNAGWYGQQPQTVRQPSFEGGSKFQYELLPDPAHDCYQLHVYGDTVWSNSPNRYAYCVVEKSSSVYKVSIKYEELEPCIDGIGRYHVDLYFPFFLAEYHYVTVDKYGEHPIPINTVRADYRPFIEEGKVWKEVQMLAFTNIPDKEHYKFFDGDTIIDERVCKKMYMADTPFEKQQRIYVGAWYEENKQVFFARQYTDHLILFYDFNLSVGEEFEMQTIYQDYMLKGIVANIHYDGDDFSKMTALEIAPLHDFHNGQEAYDYEDPLLWRVGVGGYQVNDNAPEGAMVGGNIQTAACYVGDEVIFYDAALTNTDSDVKKNWLDFTHTVKTKPKAPCLTPNPSPVGEGSEEEETVTGEYSVKELFVNFKTLAGPYTITVTDAAEQPIYNKVVQTSNVVALNTDISTYPKGSYTITVENEEEMYTAEFNFDEEDGLTPNPSPVGEGNYVGEGEAGAVYDLSGRRIVNSKSETLPLGGVGGGLSKGIYIINGRKVVVK